MNLALAALGKPVLIERVGGERAFRRRLMELGLLPGTRVEPVGVAPLGDPIELLVRGASLSIRRSEAELIAVVALEAEPVRSMLHSTSGVDAEAASVPSAP